MRQREIISSAFTMCFTRRKPGKSRSSERNSVPEDEYSQDVISSFTSSSNSTGMGTSSSQIRRGARLSLSSSSGSSLAGVRDMVSDGVMVFEYKELSRATKRFDPSGKIGSSSFRAKVRNQDVFIFLHRRSSIDNMLEKLKILCSVHHASVVKILGACFSDDQHICIVYEYLEGLNLQECLRNSRIPGFTVLDSWTKRLQIAVEVAQGLEYLHDYTSQGFMHKYIKSSNIIVDSLLHSKIAKFGVPQLTGEIDWRVQTESIDELSEVQYANHSQERNLKTSQTFRISGAPGYMAPEYVSNRMVTKKIDVYAFGVILLELLTGKDPATAHHNTAGGRFQINVSLPDMARAITNENAWAEKLRLWIDPSLKDSYPLKPAYDVVLLAKACVEPNPEDRPEMRDIAVKLSKLLNIFRKWETSMAAARSLQSKTMEAR